MRTNKICEYLDKKYPQSLKEEWDVCGKLIDLDNKTETKSVLICLDLTNEVIDKALINNSKLIVSHHPFFEDNDDFELSKHEKDMITRLRKNDIQFFAMHTNFDNSPNGMNYHLLKNLFFNKISWLDDDPSTKILVGKTKISYSTTDLANLIKNTFDPNTINFISEHRNKKISTVALIAGCGFSYVSKNIDLIAKKCDAVVTSDVKWHDWTFAKINNLPIISVSHDIEHQFVDVISSLLKIKFKDLKIIECEKAIKLNSY